MLKQLTLNILVEEQGEAYVAHCLEMGLVATSPDRSDALTKMQKMVSRYCEFAAANNRLGEIFRPAPNALWEKYLGAGPRIEEVNRQIRADDHGDLLLCQHSYAAVS